MMEITFSDILSIITLLAGGGGIGWWFTWRYTRRKERAEAVTAEASAAKELQDVYQQLINDVKTDRDEQKQYIAELKDDRNHLRRDRDELRKRQDDIEENMRKLQRQVTENVSLLHQLRPFLCGREDCAIRVPVAALENVGAKAVVKCPRKKKDEESI